ncbi:MAG: FG-GAP repeat domain-containing protein [Pirellulaceae bacterium]
MASRWAALTWFSLGCAVTAGVAAAPWTRHTIDRSSRGADGVRLRDVNADGVPDIATGWEEGGVVRVYTNPGPAHVRGPWPAVTAGAVRAPEDAVLIDLDGDGATDVVSCCEAAERTVYVHWAPATASQHADPTAWSTVPFDATRGKQMWMFALPCQLDERHGSDLLVGSKGPKATISWLEAPANPRQTSAWRLHSLRRSGWIMSLRQYDMDGDGDQDILFSDRKSETRGVAWLEHPGIEAVRRDAAWAEHTIGGSDREVMFLAVHDPGTGAAPAIAAATADGPLLVFERARQDAEWHRDEIPLPPGMGTGKGVAWGDMDLDGTIDLVFTCERAARQLSGVGWLRQHRSPAGRAERWQPFDIGGPEGVKYDRVELIDLDADGDLDVLTCEEADNLGVIWYENPVR